MLGACVNGTIANVAKVCIKQPRPYPYAKEGYGMPSSHSQSIFYFFIALWLEAVKINNATSAYLLPVLTFVSVYLIAASFVRVVAGYHTFSQVAVGCILGLLFGYVGCEIIYYPSILAVVRGMGAPPLGIKLALITVAAVGLYGRDIIKQTMKRTRAVETKLQ